MTKIGRSYGLQAFRTTRTDAPMEYRQMMEQGRQDKIAETMHPGEQRKRKGKGPIDHPVVGYGGRTFEEYLAMWRRIDAGPYTSIYSLYRAPFTPKNELMVTREKFCTWFPFLSSYTRGKDFPFPTTEVAQSKIWDAEYLLIKYDRMLTYFDVEGIPVSEIVIRFNRIYLTRRWLEFLDRKRADEHPEDNDENTY